MNQFMRKIRILSILMILVISLSALIPSVNAWGPDAHDSISGNIATVFGLSDTYKNRILDGCNLPDELGEPPL